ncbi:MAG: hypothetical protein IPK76_26115 [Lewinellaceae bacterium]|nr:hypothetical protein [Lewinellaceae bacterium]
MITAVDNGKEIARLQKQMQLAFKNQKPESIRAIIGSPGGAFGTKFLYFKAYDIWVVFEEGDNRYWNAFGIGRPIPEKNNSITCEINFPYEGIDRRIAGVWGKDSDNVVLLHRGKIGGGRKGIGKSLFLDKYRGEYVNILDGDTENHVALIGSLNSKRFLQQVANFVHEVHRIKNLAEDAAEDVDSIDDEQSMPDLGFDFTAEGHGKRRYTRREEIEAISNHGIIINALADQLTSRGFAVGNDRKRDLFTVNNDKIDRLFEAKTDLSNGSIYSAVGQLMMYSAEKCLDDNHKVLVLPKKLKASAEKTVAKLGLDILYYIFDDETVHFIDLDRILKKR